MPLRPANRIAQVQDPVIPIVGQLIQAHPGTISLGQGIVHYAPPETVQKQLEEHSNAPPFSFSIHRYGDVAGSLALREAIRIKLRDENRLPIDAQEVVYTAGSNMGFLNAVLAIADVEDEIVIMSPYYFNHEMAIRIAGCKPVLVPTRSDYQLDLKAIEAAISPRTRAIVTISPNNPTGAVYLQDSLERVNQLCAAHQIFHISDEAYEYFTYDQQQHCSPGSFTGAAEHTISLFTLSKAYGMAGWRCGYMAVPSNLLLSIQKIQDTNLVCPPMINQHAARAALEAGSSWCQPHVRRLETVRNRVLSELDCLSGCTLTHPSGAFYALLNLDTSLNDMQLVETLIKEHGVAVLPGSTFGVQSRCTIRISYGALAGETVLQGIGRLKSGLSAIL